MIYRLTNDTLKITVESLGAELKSVIKDGKEYMWCGDERYWNRTSPVLFPFVGSLKGGVYRYKGHEYPMVQHGFAKDSEFEAVDQDADSLTLELRSNEETLKSYPMPFVLRVRYKLLDSAVEVFFEVRSLTGERIYFSLGAHPGFVCPINGESDKTGYSLMFDDTKELHYFGNDKATRLTVKERHDLKLDNNRVMISPDFFDKYTYIFEDNQTRGVSILDKHGEAYVKVEFAAPLFAIWSPAHKNAPFICIEPWFGRSDSTEFDGELSERDYEYCIEGNEVFKTSYKMIFGKELLCEEKTEK